MCFTPNNQAAWDWLLATQRVLKRTAGGSTEAKIGRRVSGEKILDAAPEMIDAIKRQRQCVE